MSGALADNDRTGVLRWYWDLFRAFRNVATRDTTDDDDDESSERWEGRGLYLDIWKPPDAHTMTPNAIGVDCFHCELTCTTTEGGAGRVEEC